MESQASEGGEEGLLAKALLQPISSPSCSSCGPDTGSPAIHAWEHAEPHPPQEGGGYKPEVVLETSQPQTHPPTAGDQCADVQ